MGLIWACKDLNITSVELQHGYLTNVLQVESWSRIPPEGYELRPDIYYVWSEIFKEGIEKMYPAGCTHHRAVVGNHGWMSKVIEQEPAVDSIDESFLDYLKERKKTILVTLQGRAQGVPAMLFEAMKRLPDDWLWLMRCHPYSNALEADKVIEILRSHQIHNYEIEKTTANPLFSLLKYVDHHVTGDSSSCLESLVYGVPTTFYSPAGCYRYKEHIDMGFFNYASSADALIRFLTLDYDKSMVKQLSPYFYEMDRRVGRRAFEYILNYSTVRNAGSVSYGVKIRDYNRLGELFFQKGDIQNAIRSFQNAITLNPANTEAYNNLGALCWHRGNVQDAAKCIEAALRINPADKRSLQNWRELLRARSLLPRSPGV
jgi:tetratricopeptide (TPR) repeat protein